MDRTATGARGLALILALVVVLGTLPGLAAAETRTGGTVVVEEGETVDGLDAFGGTVVVRGTVDGDLQVYGGDVRVEGEVTGDVVVFAGNVWIGGQVGGDVGTAAGTVLLAPDAVVGGTFSAAAGNVVLAGTVRGDAELAGGSVTLAETATVDGNVEYEVGEDGQFTDQGASVGGTVSRVEDVEAGPVGPWTVPQVPAWTFGVYGFFVNLLLGALLLLLFPAFSAAVATRVAADPLRTAGLGLLTLVAVPVLLVALVITILGIPLALVGGLLFGLLLWVALVYGRFAVGAWLLALADVGNRWLALVVGLLLLGLAARIPWVGWLVDLVVLLLGLGAVAAILWTGYRGRRA